MSTITIEGRPRRVKRTANGPRIWYAGAWRTVEGMLSHRAGQRRYYHRNWQRENFKRYRRALRARIVRKEAKLAALEAELRHLLDNSPTGQEEA